MSVRLRKNQMKFRKHTHRARERGLCEFCKFESSDNQVLKTGKHFNLADNIFPYDIWDSCGVVDHLLVIPKRHVDSIAHFNSQERKEYMDLLAEYEIQGYSIYSRSPLNSLKSVVHQHTHLIKSDNKRKKLIGFILKPYFLLIK